MQERRQNLQGRVLSVSILEYFPTNMIKDDNKTYYGLSIDILQFCQVNKLRMYLNDNKRSETNTISMKFK